MAKDWNTENNPLSVAVMQRDMETLQMVRDALYKGDVMLAFQPVVLAGDSSKLSFFEGLIRVLDHTGRVIPAKDFIGTIEALEEGRIIDCLALEHGVKALQRYPNLRLSINISPRSIGLPRWEHIFEEAVHADPTLGERLIIEITESSAIANPDLVVNFMDRLHAKGVSFALDDFGSGYTAFRYFKDFFFDLVKIDNDFVRDIDADRDNQVLVKALVSIAQHFEMFTVAEGVVTRAEATYLAEIGLDCLQGYFYGAPQLKISGSDYEFVPMAG